MRVWRFYRARSTCRLCGAEMNYGACPNHSAYKVGEIAFSEAHLNAKLDGTAAEVVAPARPLIVRLWRKLFPPKGIEMKEGEAVTLRARKWL